MFNIDAISSESAKIAVSSRETEDSSLQAVLLMKTLPEPDGDMIAQVVLNASRVSVASAALAALIDTFGESNADWLDKKIEALKKAMSPDHPNFEVVRYL